MHKVLELPFTEARVKNIPCVLDTDTPLKAIKVYQVWYEDVRKKETQGRLLVIYNGISRMIRRSVQINKGWR